MMPTTAHCPFSFFVSNGNRNRFPFFCGGGAGLGRQLDQRRQYQRMKQLGRSFKTPRVRKWPLPAALPSRACVALGSEILSATIWPSVWMENSATPSGPFRIEQRFKSSL